MAGQRKDPLAEVPLAPNTAPTCAAFHGSLRGTWSQGGFGEVPMRVLEASSQGEKCTVRVVYGSWKAPITVEVSGSTLSFLCNRSTQGTCDFEATSGELWASYSNPAGSTNSGVFRKAAAQ
jgi:hypothetical protein